jgi:uncharacterized protein involved in response to NO
MLKDYLARAPLWSLGYRPFYLLAAAFAVFALPLWVAAWLGIGGPGMRLTVAWHSHEMLFGFASAVMAGFLFTAVRNWTGLPTPTGVTLAGLAALWVVARVLAVTGPDAPAHLLDAVFLPAVGVAIAIPVWRSRNVRNYKVLAIIAVLAALDILYQLAHGGVLPAPLARTALVTAIDVVAILMAVMGGRVIPAFTANAIPGARLQRVAIVEWSALGSIVLLAAADLLRPGLALPDHAWAGLAAFCALAHLVRVLLWHPWQTRGNVLLWMLPAAYAWIPAAYAIRACAESGWVSPILATHALTIGAMGSLMIAMMMRSALGHSGRPLAAGPWELTAFLLVQLSAAVRVGGGMILPGQYLVSVPMAAVLWSAAFGIFLFRYWPLLTRPREI